MFHKLAVTLTTVLATFTVFVSAAPQPLTGILGGILGHGHGHGHGSVHHPVPVGSTTTTTPTSNNGNVENSWNTGPVQCCNQTFSSSGSHGSLLESLLGIDLGDVTAMVGLECTPITALVGLGSGASCATQPVCCSGNTFNGLVNIGCSPVNVAL